MFRYSRLACESYRVSIKNEKWGVFTFDIEGDMTWRGAHECREIHVWMPNCQEECKEYINLVENENVKEEFKDVNAWVGK